MLNSSLKRGIVTTSAIVFSEFVAYFILRLPSLPDGSSWTGAFRGYFSFDQLSYAGIASTAASGNLGTVEPFTETGTSYYPSLWYKVVGVLSSATGSSVPATWTIAGLIVVGLAIVIIGLVAYRISNRAWAPALVGPALCIGTLSTVLHGEWFTGFTTSRFFALWGPYGALYPLNAEVIGFVLAGTGLSLALLVATRQVTSQSRMVLTLSASAILIGVIANVHTYAFFVAIALLFAWAGAFGLVRSRSRTATLVTVLLIILTFAVGNLVSERVGAIPTFGLLILCTVPGLWLAARTQVRILIIPGLLLLVTAAPQFLLVASGYLGKSEFLSYRESQSDTLTVPIVAGLIAALPFIAVWFYNVVVLRRTYQPAALGLSLSIAFTFLMLSFNNLWGFAQEPYRMWIDSVTLGALLLAPLTALSMAKSQDAARVNGGRKPTIIRLAGVSAIALFAVALMDVGGFRIFANNQGTIAFDTNRYAALEQVAEPVDGLLTAEPCIDPQHLKIVTRKPVAFYNLGIAWPQNKAGIDGVLAAAAAGTFSAEALRNGGVSYLVTDSMCPTQWKVEGTMGVIKIRSIDYSDPSSAGTLTLWKLI